MCPQSPWGGIAPPASPLRGCVSGGRFGALITFVHCAHGGGTFTAWLGRAIRTGAAALTLASALAGCVGIAVQRHIAAVFSASRRPRPLRPSRASPLRFSPSGRRSPSRGARQLRCRVRCGGHGNFAGAACGVTVAFAGGSRAPSRAPSVRRVGHVLHRLGHHGGHRRAHCCLQPGLLAQGAATGAGPIAAPKPDRALEPEQSPFLGTALVLVPVPITGAGADAGAGVAARHCGAPWPLPLPGRAGCPAQGGARLRGGCVQAARP